MSDSDTIAAERKDSVVIRFAGDSGDLSGSQAYLEDHYGLSARKLAAAAAEVLHKK